MFLDNCPKGEGSVEHPQSFGMRITIQPSGCARQLQVWRSLHSTSPYFQPRERLYEKNHPIALRVLKKDEPLLTADGKGLHDGQGSKRPRQINTTADTAWYCLGTSTELVWGWYGAGKEMIQNWCPEVDAET